MEKFYFKSILQVDLERLNQIIILLVNLLKQKLQAHKDILIVFMFLVKKVFNYLSVDELVS